MMTSPGQRPTMGPPLHPSIRLGRAVLIFYHGDSLKCFNGHVIEDPVIEVNTVRCRKLLERDGRHCDQRLFLFAGVQSIRGESGGVIVTQISEDESKLLDRSGKTPRDVLRILGLTL
jgi:hypothetical protein